ncbi:MULTISPECIES: copper homeostasis periplasmic binding protein CopC [Cupriavidus]|jgi:methionine-rich copper-binding protein CopC|uniref:Copper resistance protein C n=7 Tax=Burkholderiaceae TaxID=119060 RepID=A0A375DU74_9BURK|nr:MULTISPECIES: copper homeostasis periplasmic binding protein CopC [Cupriavidus]QQE08013.1 copper homeostasis periplasmic binding protein CopC [Cupriavidus sp. ISTL7]AMR78381.1 copper resistance protein CopC [Cupriavidus nantongensis]KAA6117639.1 copper homeostasis periplasmic binding protein CopC [Cupriavidus cauae]KAB0595289.1 copper homeostasis periplasmic binding protein CopC [Cupriavidus gilardii]MBO4120591.1 copper homeostasis periplasmic binding protein CopC [Cupriavidus gilardii]
MQAPRFTIRAALAAAAVLASTAAFAHPKLVSSMPADKAEVAAPQKIELKFSENLATQFSGASLVMTSMPGMANHAPMKIAAKVAGSDDPKTMVITPAQTLAPGSYRVDWRAVSSDTHPINGNIAFTVK